MDAGALALRPTTQCSTCLSRRASEPSRPRVSSCPCRACPFVGGRRRHHLRLRLHRLRRRPSYPRPPPCTPRPRRSSGSCASPDAGGQLSCAGGWPAAARRGGNAQHGDHVQDAPEEVQDEPAPHLVLGAAAHDVACAQNSRSASCRTPCPQLGTKLRGLRSGVWRGRRGERACWGMGAGRCGGWSPYLLGRKASWAPAEHTVLRRPAQLKARQIDNAQGCVPLTGSVR